LPQHKGLAAEDRRQYIRLPQRKQLFAARWFFFPEAIDEAPSRATNYSAIETNQ
jgi:hypothetical protein